MDHSGIAGANRQTITKRDGHHRAVLEGLVAILLISTVAQFAFSSLGFNPTDDGFILAGSRRILDGEIPHMDFISIRTAGSYYLHAPILAISEDHTLWASRYFAWTEFACTSWIWTLIALRSFSLKVSYHQRIVLGFTVFCFSSQIFPIMAWHSVDALLFASFGVYLILGNQTGPKIAGFLLLGAAILFRQNFLLTLPVALLVSGDWRRISCWAACSSPMAVYIACMYATGALNDFIMQLTTYGAGTSFVTGMYSYLAIGTPVAALFGYIAATAIQSKNAWTDSHRIQDTMRFVALFILCGGPILSILLLAVMGIVHTPSYLLFGICIGVTAFYWRNEGMTYRTKYGVMSLTLAWCVSLSVGYNSPVLVSGAIVMLLVLSALPSGQSHVVGFRTSTVIPRRLNLSSGYSRDWMKLTGTVLVVTLLVITPICWSCARVAHIYRETPMSQLTFDLGEVLAGGEGVRTDENTYRFLADLRNATRFVESQGKEYVILPDCAAFWIGSSQRNPISCDWPQNTELGSDALLERVETDLQHLRGNVIILVQKVEASSLAQGFVELPDKYKIVQYVSSSYVQIGETEFFALYE